MASHKRQHYVPQFYLRAFSTNRKGINLWNIRRAKRILSARLRTQCCSSYFHGKDRELEKTLGGMEALAARILRDVADGSPLPPFGRRSNSHCCSTFSCRTRGLSTRWTHSNEQTDKLAKEVLGGTFDQLGVDPATFRIGFDDGARFPSGWRSA